MVYQRGQHLIFKMFSDFEIEQKCLINDGIVNIYLKFCLIFWNYPAYIKEK